MGPGFSCYRSLTRVIVFLMTDSPALTSPLSDSLLLPYLNHAVRMYEEKYATRDDIDAAMRFGCGYRVGPLATIDTLGVRAVRDALAARCAVSGDELDEPVAFFDQMLAQGREGASTGRGFFTWVDGAPVPDEESPSLDDAPQLRRAISRIGVVGTGTMAAGIVQVFAQAGYDVVFVGRSSEKVDGVITAVAANLDRSVEKGKLTAAERSNVLERLDGATERAALGDVDLVVEAIAEDLDLKTQLFADLDRICKPGAILATTTSSLPIMECAAATARAHDVIGMHFFNPAVVMKLVEVVTTPSTAPEVDETVRALCAQIGKVAVSCGDRAGFIVNCLLFPYLNDAVKAHEAGAPIETVDADVKEHLGFPMGPFQLLDVVGNDVSLAIQKELHAEFGHAGFAPAALLESVVAQGRLGRKTKRGFHDHH